MAVERNLAERARELLAVARHHQQAHAVVVQPDLGDVIFAEQPRRHARRVAAADEVLARVLLDLLAHRADGSLGDDHPVGDQHDLVADQIHFLQDVAREDDVLALARPGAEQRDRLGAHQRVKAVQRLVEDEHFGIVRDRLRQPDALPHALGIRTPPSGSPPRSGSTRSSAFHAFSSASARA